MSSIVSAPATIPATSGDTFKPRVGTLVGRDREVLIDQLSHTRGLRQREHRYQARRRHQIRIVKHRRRRARRMRELHLRDVPCARPNRCLRNSDSPPAQGHSRSTIRSLHPSAQAHRWIRAKVPSQNRSRDGHWLRGTHPWTGRRSPGPSSRSAWTCWRRPGVGTRDAGFAGMDEAAYLVTLETGVSDCAGSGQRWRSTASSVDRWRRGVELPERSRLRLPRQHGDVDAIGPFRHSGEISASLRQNGCHEPVRSFNACTVRKDCHFRRGARSRA